MIPQITLAAALALLWVGATGVTTIPNLFAGTLIAAITLVYLHGRGGDVARRIWRAVALFFYFVWELILANLWLAYDIMTPSFFIQAGIIGVPLDATSDVEIWLLATMITLTPGTLSVDVSRDKRILWVHGMYISDRDAFVRGIKNGFERRLLEITR
jgi:multicomponent Na+:H+ antiporter subunit E